MGGASAPVETDATRTSVHLALALLGYFLLVIVVITLSPFDFAWAPVRLLLAIVPSDIIANVALFLPLGFLLHSLDRRESASALRAVSVAAGISILIEIAQIFIRDRYVSPVDVIANTCGAYIGVLVRDRLERMAVWHPTTVGRLSLDIPLVGLLYLLVPQLWLSTVGVLEDGWRGVTTVLLASASAIVLIALRRNHWNADATASRDRRFEHDTLRRFLPVFALYLIVAALWPPFRALAPWHGAVGFANRLNDAGVVDLLLLLEQVGGFTLLGYAAAEWSGRRELSLGADLPRVTLAAVAFATLLEVAQGSLAGPGASLLRALFSTTGAMYGAAVYHLARAHVRALRAGEMPQTVSDRAEAA